MNELAPMLERAFSRQALHTGEIPALDLYMDQVITLIENGYAANKRTPDEKLLTKTMVQNYSKAGLVRPIKGKKYTPEHIIQMLIIYTLKRTLTIGEIKQALDALYTQKDWGEEDLAACYEQALSQKETLSASITTLLSEHTAQCDTPADRFSALLTTAVLSESFARLSEEMLDQWFSSPHP